jgi:hypothetical protein
MTGNEIVAALKKHKGDVCVAALLKHDAPYVRVVKSDLIMQLESIGVNDAGCYLRVSEGIGYVDSTDSFSFEN